MGGSGKRLNEDQEDCWQSANSKRRLNAAWQARQLHAMFLIPKLRI